MRVMRFCVRIGLFIFLCSYTPRNSASWRVNLIGREKTLILVWWVHERLNYSFIAFYGISYVVQQTRTHASTYARYVCFIQRFLSPFWSPYFDEKELTSWRQNSLFPGPPERSEWGIVWWKCIEIILLFITINCTVMTYLLKNTGNCHL